MAATNNETIQLRDGRTLGYSEHGDLSGKPVIFIHGNPGSRLMRHPDETIAERLGVRIITPDRPGYGLSDYQPKRTLLDFPADIEQLADALALREFAVFGVSAGGPYAAVTAWKLGERVTQAAIVSGSAPFDRPNPYAGVNETYTRAYKLAKQPFLLLRLLMWIAQWQQIKKPEAYWQDVLERNNAYDVAMLEKPAIKAQVQNYLPEAIRNGGKGRVQEAKLLVAPWGFRLEEIDVPVHLWYWEDDHIVPVQMGKYLEKRIPNTIDHFLPGGGHFAIFEHWQQILQALLK